MFDALGNKIIVGNWYGYSRNDGGHSHTTIGKALKVSEAKGYEPAKVRLGECKSNHYVYGEPTTREWRQGKPDAAGVSIMSRMVFPVKI